MQFARQMVTFKYDYVVWTVFNRLYRYGSMRAEQMRYVRCFETYADV